MPGFAGPSDLVSARDVGAEELIARPYNPNALLARIHVHLKQRVARGSRAGRGEKILVVDDLEINVEALATQLEGAGYHPLRALSGAQALTLAREHKPDAIISDVMMPGMTGYD